MGASVKEASWSCVRRKRRASEALARRGAFEVRGCPDPAPIICRGGAGRMPALRSLRPTDPTQLIFWPLVAVASSPARGAILARMWAPPRGHLRTHSTAAAPPAIRLVAPGLWRPCLCGPSCSC